LAAAAFGIRIEGDRPADDRTDVYLWPECAASWGAWFVVQTQWRVGPSGHRTGLDHASVLADLRSMGYGPGKRRSIRRVHSEIIAMERGALDGWAETIERDRRAKGSVDG
jgi:hypothetical protein